MTKTIKDILKDPTPKTSWDDRIDPKKFSALTPKERHKLFPDEYDRDGNPYGDF